MIIAKMDSQFIVLPTLGLIKEKNGIFLSFGWMNWVISFPILKYITKE